MVAWARGPQEGIPGTGGVMRIADLKGLLVLCPRS